MKWITIPFKHELITSSFMPPVDNRQFCDLMHYRYKLTCFMSSKKNHFQNCLTVSTIQFKTLFRTKHLCSWLGLTPTNNESAQKKKSVQVSKAGCYIKPLLSRILILLLRVKSILKSVTASSE